MVTIQLNSRGTDVKRLQQALGVTPADGICGPMTVNAIKTFQLRNGITPDGIAGPKTLALLFPSQSSPSLTESSAAGALNILHERVANIKRGNRAYCISHVYIDGKYSHDTIEDYDRGLDESMTESQIAKIKVYSKTAIPTGHYTVKMNIVSGTFSKKPYYKAFCGGKVPRLDPVKGFAGILIHRGVNEDSSAGCVIVGMNKSVGSVTDSQAVFERIYRIFKDAAARGATINYTITRKYKV